MNNFWILFEKYADEVSDNGTLMIKTSLLNDEEQMRIFIGFAQPKIHLSLHELSKKEFINELKLIEMLYDFSFPNHYDIDKKLQMVSIISMLFTIYSENDKYFEEVLRDFNGNIHEANEDFFETKEFNDFANEVTNRHKFLKQLNLESYLSNLN